MALNPFDDVVPDRQHNAEVVRDGLSIILSEFDWIVKDFDAELSEDKDADEVRAEMLVRIEEISGMVLPPEDITAVMTEVIDKYGFADMDSYPAYTEAMKDKYNAAVFLVSDLIQSSYEHGNNEFELNACNIKPFHFASGLKGNKDNRIKMSIFGDVGNYCGANSRYADFDIQGNVGWGCGRSNEWTRYIISGDIEPSIACWSKDVLVTVSGRLSYNGDTRGNEFFLDSNRCVLQVSNQEDFDNMRKHSYLGGGFNGLDLLDSYGSVLKKVRK
jgi:hypothetical protein